MTTHHRATSTMGYECSCGFHSISSIVRDRHILDCTPQTWPWVAPNPDGMSYEAIEEETDAIASYGPDVAEGTIDPDFKAALVERSIMLESARRTLWR